MTDNPDYIIDRRKLKSHLNKWRGIAVAIGVAALLAAVFLNNGLAARLGLYDQIARIEISGIISEDEVRARLLREMKRNVGVRAVIVKFNSPGGTTTGGEALYSSLRAIAKERPVVAVFGTMATSAAYMSGVAADHIVARGNSITGSVGVILQWAEVSQMMDKIGVQMNEIKSGPLKAVPSPFQPLDEAGKQLSQEMIDESHKWFVDLVAKRRKLNVQEIPGFMAGRIYSGRQALQYGMVDAIGGEEKALEWLHSQKDIPTHLPVIDWMADSSTGTGIFGFAGDYIFKQFGIQLGPIFANSMQNGLISSTQSDGLISKWR